MSFCFHFCLIAEKKVDNESGALKVWQLKCST